MCIRDSRGYEVEVYPQPEAPPKGLIIDKVKSGIDGLITTLRDPIDAEVFEAGKSTLKIVAQYAVGSVSYTHLPGFPIYESMIHYVGGRAVPIHLREDRDFSLDVDELAALITDRTRLIILNSPHNPTGGVMQRRDVEQVAKVIGERNILVLSDEIYSRLLFEGEHFSIMSVPGMQERTILLDGFSKTYAMTGWRMGYGVMRADLAAHIARLMTNSNSCLLYTSRCV